MYAIINVLIYIFRHNVHQYLEFFKIIRENIKRDTFDDYKKKINLKFKQNNVIQAEEFTCTKDTKPISL